METPFQLTKPGPALSELVHGEELIRRIKTSAASRRQRRPKLVAWSFRIEVGLHSQLQDAAKKLDPLGLLAMSDIVNGLLETFLPVILAQRMTAGEQILANPTDREKLANLLAGLTDLLQKPQS